MGCRLGKTYQTSGSLAVRMLESFSFVTRGRDLGPGISALDQHFVEVIGGLSSAGKTAGDSNNGDGRVRHVVSMAKGSVVGGDGLVEALLDGLATPEKVLKGYIENF